jgi:hypothetical protein
MKLMLAFMATYDVSDESAREDYECTDPAECAEVDQENVDLLGTSEFLALIDNYDVLVQKIVPVGEFE